MDVSPKINLLQFVRKKQSKRFLLKFAAYFFMIGFILFVLFKKLNENETAVKDPKEQINSNEIRGVTIQLESDKNK